MKAVDIPVKFNIPFGNGAGAPFINPIPEASQIGITDGRASLQTGFPPDTFVPTGAGGVAPFGADANGILFESTSWDRWLSAGGPLKWDSAFSAAVGGYPAGAVVSSTTVLGLFWLCLVDDNTSNPDASGAGWQSLSFGAFPTGQCYFQWTNTTQAKLVPKGGNRITISGIPRAIPSAGVTLDITNCFINGVAAQATVPNTTYNAYLFDNSGTLTIDLWTGSNSGHVVDTTAGNVGVEVRNVSGTPDSTRSLVGKVGTDGSGNLTGPLRSIISWFNQEALSLTLAVSGGIPQVTSATPLEISSNLRVAFLSWGTSAIQHTMYGSCTTNSGGSSTNMLVGLNSSTVAVGLNASVTAINTTQLLPIQAYYGGSAPEGLNFITPLGSVTVAATATYSGISQTVIARG